jgi:hypothetical protein
MTRHTRALLLFTVFAGIFTTGCGGPFLIIPGGALSGEVVTEPVTDWSFLEDGIFELETRPDDPYSVNIWGVGVGEYFYVAASDAQNEWAKGIAADENVRLKVGESLFELRGVRVEDEAEIEVCLTAIKRKYDFEPDADQRGSATLFRLEPRAPGA